MSRGQGGFWLKLVILLVIAAGAGPGCRTCGKAPCFYTDASVRDSCQGKPPGDHDIYVDDMGGVGAGDSCVVIKRNYPGHGNSVRWLPKSGGKEVSIVFLLSQDQPVPFERMACGLPDKNGNRLCVLTDCPRDCKTTFRADYRVVEPTYYYYSPGVTTGRAREAKAGSDPGIRIDP